MVILTSWNLRVWRLRYSSYSAHNLQEKKGEANPGDQAGELHG